MKLTVMEKKFMNAMRDNEYNDCLDGYDGTNFDTMVGCGTWTFTAIDNSGLTPKQCTGVMSSLTKKGLIDSEQADTKRLGDEDSVWFTEEGAKLFIDADGDECSWGGFRLLKIEDETPKTKKTSKKQDKVVNVVIYTFTGMRIQNERQAKLVDGIYLVPTKNGMLEFDAKTMKQVNAKNPKFANTIKLV